MACVQPDVDCEMEQPASLQPDVPRQQEEAAKAVQQENGTNTATASTTEPSSSGVKKKVKRNVAMHIGYVGTKYTGDALHCHQGLSPRALPNM